jgi:MYXO-CTERM domain-containing protein
MSLKSVSALVVALAAGSAHAAFISFASDTNPNAPTFNGVGGTMMIMDSFDPNGHVDVDLTVDPDEHGPGPSFVVKSELHFDVTLTNYTRTMLFNGTWEHKYFVEGEIEFHDHDTHEENIVATLDSGFFVSYSDVETALGTTATMQWSLLLGPGSSSGPFIDTYGQLDQIAFTFTDIRRDEPGATDRALVNADGSFVGEWFSEGSMSGRLVPAPGAVALLGLGGIIAGRRRK